MYSREDKYIDLRDIAVKGAAAIYHLSLEKERVRVGDSTVCVKHNLSRFSR